MWWLIYIYRFTSPRNHIFISWNDCSRFQKRKQSPSATTTIQSSLKGPAKKFNVSQAVVYGALLEKHRLGFELYDYARELSAKHLIKYGLRSSKPEFPKSSYMEAIEAFGIDTAEFTFHTNAIAASNRPRRSHKNFCSKLHSMWATNGDEMPFVLGIGGLRVPEGVVGPNENTGWVLYEQQEEIDVKPRYNVMATPRGIESVASLPSNEVGWTIPLVVVLIYILVMRAFALVLVKSISINLKSAWNMLATRMSAIF